MVLGPRAEVDEFGCHVADADALLQRSAGRVAQRRSWWGRRHGEAWAGDSQVGGRVGRRVETSKANPRLRACTAAES